MDNVSVFHLDGPVVMIHKGWQSQKPLKPFRDRTTGLPSPAGADLKRQDSTVNKIFTFVDSTQPGRTKDSDVRKIIRSHVRNEYVRLNRTKKGRQKGSVLDEPGDMGIRATDLPISIAENRSEWPLVSRPQSQDLFHGVQRAEDSVPAVSRHGKIRRHFTSEDSSDSEKGSINLCIPALLGFPTETSDYPIDMSSETHRLLSYYLTSVSSRIFPIESCFETNPLKSPEWLHFAVTDSAMFHAVLYAAAVSIALVRGKHESRDSIYHQSQTISILQKRMSGSTKFVADSTLGAISCLALGEAVSGNEHLWRLHMKGLKHVLLSRGGLSSLSPLMLAKLRRTDITGAIDYAATPLLEFERSSSAPTWSMIPQQSLREIRSGLSRVLLKSQIHANIVAIMVDLAYFVRAISIARSSSDITLDPTTFSEDLYWIEHSLLSAPNSVSDSEEAPINMACRLGALLYLKTLLQEFPQSVAGASILTRQLRAALDAVYMMADNMSLLTWLALVGAMSSKSRERAWFIVYLEQSAKIGGAVSFLDEEFPLGLYLGLENIFGRLLGDVWNEVSTYCSSVNFTEFYPEVEISA